MLKKTTAKLTVDIFKPRTHYHTMTTKYFGFSKSSVTAIYPLSHLINNFPTEHKHKLPWF